MRIRESDTVDKPYLDTVIYDNFYEMIRGRYDNRRDTDAVRYMDGDSIVSITYGRLTAEIAAMHRFIGSRGLTGRHIAIVSENRYEYIVIYLAAVLDSVIVPIDRELDGDTIADCLGRFDVDAVFCTDKTAGKLRGGVTAINIDREYSGIIGEKVSVEEFFDEVKDTDKDRFAVLASLQRHYALPVSFAEKVHEGRQDLRSVFLRRCPHGHRGHVRWHYPRGETPRQGKDIQAHDSG